MNNLIKKYKENPILESGFPKYLFRGQNNDWGSIKSTFGRLENDEKLIGHGYTIYRRARQICSGLSGFYASHEESMAVLQHYGMPTPSIDLTGNIDISLFFALYGLTKQDNPVIFVVDTEKVPETIHLTEHSFLMDKPEFGGLNNRWLKQDGYAIMTKNWMQTSEVRGFDLKDFEGQFLIKEPIEDWQGYKLEYDFDFVYDKSKDKIPSDLKHNLEIFTNQLFGDTTHPRIAELIDKIDK